LPLVLVFLLIVFGSVVAAMLPLAVGLLGVGVGMAVTGLLSRVMPVSAYAANVVSMIGLGVAIDYSLFVVSPYRGGLPGPAPPVALSRTLAPAGRTVIFSGMAVGIGLLGMILLRMGSVSTIGIASTVVVGFAVVYSLTLLPALLAILGPRVNSLSLWRGGPTAGVGTRSLWHRLPPSRHGAAVAGAGAGGARPDRPRAAVPPYPPRHAGHLDPARARGVAPGPGAPGARLPAARAQQHRGRSALSRQRRPHPRARGRAAR